MRIERSLIQEQKRFTFTWPEGTKEYFAPALTYRVHSPKGVPHLVIGFGWREAFRRERRRIIVFSGNSWLWPVVEFVGVDDYDRTKELVWPIKKPGGNRQYRLSEEPHPDFRSLRVVPFRDRVGGPGAFKGWSILVREDDHNAMIELALIRAEHRSR